MSHPIPALAYFALIVLVAGTIARAVKYARAPMHLRWELYPVPHEKGRDHGGSYFEQVDWWTHERETSLRHEIAATLEEILLIRSLWHRNRPQWYASFPFHMGLYVLIGFVVLLSLEAGPAAWLLDRSPVWPAIETLTAVLGVAGLFAGALGAAMLLCRRLFDPTLRSASCFADYFNLAFALVVFGSALVSWAGGDPMFLQLRDYLAGLLSLSPRAAASLSVATEVAAVSLFMIYLPFTHMTHFVAKYFAYHQIRWDDEPNTGGPATHRRMSANLGRPVGWSAAHIPPGKSWAEAATEVE